MNIAFLAALSSYAASIPLFYTSLLYLLLALKGFYLFMLGFSYNCIFNLNLHNLHIY